MDIILQSHLPFAPWMDPRTARLPGILPLDPCDWLLCDDAFAGQMAERERLIEAVPERVHALTPRAALAADELYDAVLAFLEQAPGYEVGVGEVRRPDGAWVTLARAAPLLTLGRLVQEDFCLLQHEGTQSVLTGAILCFPANWHLYEKIGRPLTDIHQTVDSYGPIMAARVQRLFDAIRPDRPMWRGNALIYDDAELFHPPKSQIGSSRPMVTRGFVRSERQSMMKLPLTGAVVFSIHTYLVAMESLAPEVAGALKRLHQPETS